MIVPTGTIAIWSGAEVDIPPGWIKCDGNNGTPNLEDKFIVGALSTYAVGATGGAVQHNHAFTSDLHDHRLPVGGQIEVGTDISRDTDSRVVTGTTNNTNHLPPYYALIFIMKT